MSDNPLSDFMETLKKIRDDLMKGLEMPTDYTSFANDGYFFFPKTMEFEGNTYHVDHLNRSLETSTLNDSAREIIELTAFRELGKYARWETPCNYYCKDIKRVSFSGPATIVFWEDGTKTVVKLAEGDKNDRRVALLYAFAKKKFGNNSRIHKEIDPFVSSNAQRIALLNYIIAKDGVDLDKVMDTLVFDKPLKK